VAFSDGVLDVHPGIEHEVGRLASVLRGAQRAAEVVERLARPEAEPRDDVTVVALGRTSGGSMRVELSEAVPRAR
jgi:hypothetical protein